MYCYLYYYHYSIITCNLLLIKTFITYHIVVLESNFNKIKYDEQDLSSKVRAWLDKEFKGIKPTTPNHISPAKELDHEHCTTTILLDLDSHMLIGK